MRLPCLASFIGALVLALASSGLTAVAAPTPSEREVIQRVRRYVEAWRPRLAELVGEEEFTQSDGADTTRVLVSDFATVRADDGMWVGFRDVWKVDGRELPDRPARAARLFGPNRPDWVTARQIIIESARYNVSTRVRDFNNPIAPLELLSESRDWCCRLRARRVQTRGATAWQVDVEETMSPTLIRTSERKSAYATVRAQVEPESGAITQLELQVGKANRLTMSVTYVYDESLAMWVPEAMTESFRVLGKDARGQARYRNWRRFSATSRIVPN